MHETVLENVTKPMNQSDIESGILSTIKTVINQTINNTTESNKTRDITIEILEEEFYEQVWLWIFGIYFGNIAFGLFFNGISVISLLRTKRNGTLSIILQLTSIDIVCSWVCIVELLSIKRNAWTFPVDFCPLFAGSEILINTLTLYLIISLNYHTISLCHLKTMKTKETSSCDDSQECLVRDVTSAQSAISISTSASTSTNITSTATNTQKLDISVTIPCILIWFTCLSLSIPQFTLSSTVESYSIAVKNLTCTCTLMDDSKLLVNLLAIFRVFIPCILMFVSLCIMVYKLVTSLRNDSIPAIFTKKCHNVVYYLIFCVVLNVLYLCTSMQRLILYAMHAYTSPTVSAARIYKLPPLYNEFAAYWVWMALCMLHYSGTFLRFLVYVFLLPKFKSILCNNFLACFKPKEL